MLHAGVTACRLHRSDIYVEELLGVEMAEFLFVSFGKRGVVYERTGIRHRDIGPVGGEDEPVNAEFVDAEL